MSRVTGRLKIFQMALILERKKSKQHITEKNWLSHCKTYFTFYIKLYHDIFIIEIYNGKTTQEKREE